MIGKTLAHYEITGLLGKGGMGEVYRAHDGKLGRDVALKILPTELSSDPERVARFDREARTLASLQHPNVASIYGFEEVSGTRFLIMELVEGSDLGSRLASGRVSVEETRNIARQIATGLESAHERGIVHRDLKPANIQLATNGEVKILDFGLARAWFGDSGDDVAMENSPTITAAMTQAGTILGTAAYMSPEQARGKSVDRRADIWAFGAILWEMLTGERLFEGETISDTLAAVLRAEPEWERLPVEDAPDLCRLIERCLARDPRQRLRDIGEARVLLQEGGNASSLLSMPTSTLISEAETTSSRGSGRIAWLTALAMTLVALALGSMVFQRDSRPQLSRTTLGLPMEEAINVTGGQGWSSLQFSPDGRSVAYVGGDTGGIYLREFDSFESTRLADTENGVLPAFSPDGRWIAFFTSSKIWKVAVSGGAPIEVCDAPVGPGLAWGQGEIYFSRSLGGGLWAVSENGGEPRPVSELDASREETSHRWPQVLPGGTHLLLTVKTARMSSFDEAGIGLLSLESGEVTVLFEGGSNPRYVPTGHLLYGRDSQLFAVPFDLETLSIVGTPTSVLERIHVSDITGSTHYAVSPEGHLAYVPDIVGLWEFELTWVSRTGQIIPLESVLPRSFEAVISPDGDRFATVVAAANDKIWVCDLNRNTYSRLTNTPGNDRVPVWSPDGESIVFQNDRDGSLDLYIIAADGSAPAELLLGSDFDDYASSWSPDGRYLLFGRGEADGDWDLWLMDMEEDRAITPFLQTPNLEGNARFSPDGEWVAFSSDSSGQPDIYVRPFPGPGNAIRVSTDGGLRPRWARDGKTLFYPDRERLMAVSFDGNATPPTGEPRALFSMGREFGGIANTTFSPTHDGERFLAGRFNIDARQHQIRIEFDWTARLGDLAARR